MHTTISTSHVCMHVCRYACMYVGMHVCMITKDLLRDRGVKDVMCVHVCIYTYTVLCLYIPKPHTHGYIFLVLCVWVRVHTYIHTYIHTYMTDRASGFAVFCEALYIHTSYIHTYIHACGFADFRHTYIQTYIHTWQTELVTYRSPLTVTKPTSF